MQPVASEVPDNQVPAGVRDGCIWVLQRTLPYGRLDRDQLKAQLAYHVDEKFRQYLDWADLRKLVRGCKWNEFYDVCESCHHFFTSIQGKSYPTSRVIGLHFAQWPDGTIPDGLASKFSEQLNTLFEDHGMGYRLNNGRIERFGSDFTSKAIQETRVLLRDLRFKGPDEQFEKAIGFLSQRPEPDTENCVKDAIGAVEGVTRIISKANKLDLRKLLEREPFRSGIHGTLNEALKKLYAYRGAAGGVARGQEGESVVGIQEAQLVLTVSAGAIHYLVNKFGEPPEQAP